MTTDVLFLILQFYESRAFQESSTARARLERVLTDKVKEIRIVVDGMRGAGHNRTATAVENMYRAIKRQDLPQDFKK